VAVSQKHPEHDRVREEVRSWYRTSSPELGYEVVRRRFGFYRHQAESPNSGFVIVDALTPDEVQEFLTDACKYFDDRAVNVFLDDKDLDLALGPALVAAGVSLGKATTYLAHVGPRPEPFQLSGIAVELVTAETLMDFVRVKLKGFANSEDEPPVEHFDQELALRKSELASIGRLLIARVGDEPAAILEYLDGNDRFIFNLATRTPFRMRGIARQLLCRVLADSYDQGCRSVIINTDPGDTPVQWYRRLGFIDEVYWRRRYFFEPAKDPEFNGP
jgi:ribosomal protein S18 acetylase RimI-like enzyme